MNIAKSLGLTAEETSALCHVIGAGGSALMVVSSLATSWMAFFHNLHLKAGEVAVTGWTPGDTLIMLVAALIAGGVLNDKLNTPPAGK